MTKRKNNGWQDISNQAKQPRTEDFELGYAVNRATGSRSLVLSPDEPAIPILTDLLDKCAKMFDRLLFFLEFAARPQNNSGVKEEKTLWKGDPSAVFRLMRVSKFFRTTIQVRFPEKFFREEFGHIHRTIMPEVTLIGTRAVEKYPADLNILTNYLNTMRKSAPMYTYQPAAELPLAVFAETFRRGGDSLVSMIIRFIKPLHIQGLLEQSDEKINARLLANFCFIRHLLPTSDKLLGDYLDIIGIGNTTYKFTSMLDVNLGTKQFEMVCAHGAKYAAAMDSAQLVQFAVDRYTDRPDYMKIFQEHFHTIAGGVQREIDLAKIHENLGALDARDLAKVLKVTTKMARRT